MAGWLVCRPHSYGEKFVVGKISIIQPRTSAAVPDLKMAGQCTERVPATVLCQDWVRLRWGMRRDQLAWMNPHMSSFHRKKPRLPPSRTIRLYNTKWVTCTLENRILRELWHEYTLIIYSAAVMNKGVVIASFPG